MAGSYVTTLTDNALHQYMQTQWVVVWHWLEDTHHLIHYPLKPQETVRAQRYFLMKCSLRSSHVELWFGLCVDRLLLVQREDQRSVITEYLSYRVRSGSLKSRKMQGHRVV